MAWLSGWAYRKAITVAHTDDGAQTNYQMKLSVFKGAGVDSIGVVYLNNHALNWPTDIQITASDGTTAVDFWREESDATDGTWWIECPTIGAGSTWTGYIYYGDVDATDESDGNATFLFFDNFPGDAIDTDKWQGYTAGAVVNGNIMSWTSDGGTTGMWGKTLVAGNVRGRMLGKLQAANYNYLGIGNETYGVSYDEVLAGYGNSWYTIKTAVNAGLFSSHAVDAGNYHICDFCRLTSVAATVRGFHDDVSVGADYTTSANIPTADLAVHVRTYLSTCTVSLKWCFLSNYTYNEPTWAASGAEETELPHFAYYPHVLAH